MVRRERGANAEIHVALLYRERRQRQLDPRVLQLAAVDDQVRDAARRDRGGLEQQVRDLAVVPGALELHPVVQELDVGSGFELLLGFRLDVHVAAHARLHEAGLAADRGARVQDGLTVAIARPIARLGPAGADLHLVDRIAEVGEPVRTGRARIDVALAAVAVRAGAVGAESADERELLGHADELLGREPRVVVEISEHVVRGVQNGAAVRGLDARQQAARARPDDALVLRLPVIARAGRQRDVL